MMVGRASRQAISRVLAMINWGNVCVVSDFFFFQAEDGIRDGRVTGVQTCALPIFSAGVRRSILEVGAGTGLVTASLADWTPAEIFALEPSAAMRAVLLSRLSSRPDLLGQVTVLSGDALSVRLDEPAEAVVMINVVYALEPDYRRRLWPALAAALEPGGLLVFTGHDERDTASHRLSILRPAGELADLRRR